MGQNFLSVIEGETDERPQSCPWRAFYDPLVAEVLRLYGACSGDMGTIPALAMQMNPSNVAFEGLLFYCRTVNRIRAADRKREKAKRDAEAKRRG